MSDHQSHNHSSFMNGFTLGILAGAGGYFLFATEHGRKVRQQVAQEWSEAKKNLVKEGVIESSDVSVREFIQQLICKLTGQRVAVLEKKGIVGAVLANHELDLSKKSVKAASKTPAKKVTQALKFKGV